MRAAGSDPLPGTGGEGLEQPAFVKAKCVTLSVGFHTAIWNQHLQSVCQNRYADLETGCGRNRLATAGNSTRTINFLLDRRPKKVAINAHKEILER